MTRCPAEWTGSLLTESLPSAMSLSAWRLECVFFSTLLMRIGSGAVENALVLLMGNNRMYADR
jgi:hypothetical protein